MMKTNNQQQSPDEGNVQRLERELVPLNGETENTLTDNAEGKDIVQSLRGLARIKNKEYFLNKAKIKYGDKFTYDLSNYISITGSKIGVICPIHGRFEITPHGFLLKGFKTGCRQCGERQKNLSKTKSYANFISKAKEVHKNIYIYPDINQNTYVNRKSKVEIICPQHGNFTKSGQKHLSGQACWQCKVDFLIKTNVLVGGYSEDLFNKRPELKDIKAYLYYLSINNGEFYKIGISKSLKKRPIGIKCKARGAVESIDVIWSIEDTLYNCFKEEQSILDKYKDNRVIRKWSTELFNKNILPLKLDNLN